MTFAEYAPQYLAQGFEPIPVVQEEKSGIPKDATGKNGVVDAAKVSSWVIHSKWKDAGLALRALDTYIALDVDQYEDKYGADQLVALERKIGQLPDTVFSTARVYPSAQRFYRVPAGLTFISKAAPDIDVVQRSHRYSVVYPSYHPQGTQYQWFDASGEEMWGLPTPDDFAELPAEWVEYLTTEGAIDHDGFEGAVEDWLTTLVPGEPSEDVHKLVQHLPTDNFTHDDVIKIVWRLVRLGAEGHAGIRWALEQINATWLKGDFDVSEYQTELNAAIEGAISKAGKVEVPELLGGTFVIKKLEDLGKADQFTSLLYDTPTDLLQARRTLIRDLYRLGLTQQEVLSGAWFSKTHDFEHPAQLWADVLAFEPVAKKTVVKGKLSLLTKAEREHLKTVPNFVGLYTFLSTKRMSRPNMPLHRLMAWTALSLTYSGKGMIPVEGRDRGMGLNLYTMGLSQSGSGKTPAFEQLYSYMEALLGKDLFWGECAVGKPSSGEALNNVLLGMDGEVSWVSDDDAYSFLEKLSDTKGYAGGLEGRFNDYYEGRVNAFQKTTDKDHSGKHADCNLSSTLIGTPKEMVDALTRRQISSGFIPRHIIAYGDPRIVDRDSLTPKQRTGDAAHRELDPHIVELAELMKRCEARFNGQRKTPIIATDSALLRLRNAREQSRILLADHPQADLIDSSLVRIDASMWKAAALIAMSRGSETIVLDDVLVAVEAAEEWIPNMVKLIEDIASNDWVAQVAEVAKVISQKPLTKTGLYRRFEKYKKFELDQITEALEAQGRARFDNHKWVSLEELEDK